MTCILSLDDEPEILRLLGMVLEVAGYEHLRVTDSSEALSILRRESVDLFTQDCMRPDMDGPKLYRLMKADRSLRHMPVLFISAGHRPKFAAACRSTYGDDYLAKPFGLQELLATVTAMLKRCGKHVPTEEERVARYQQVRARLASELDMSGEQLDALYETVAGLLAQS